jgi:hypothetical protein
MVPISPIEKVSERRKPCPIVLFRLSLPDQNDAVWIRERYRANQHGVDEGQYSRRGSDAKRNGQHRDEGEPRILLENSTGET